MVTKRTLDQVSDEELVRALENPLCVSFDDEGREIDLNRFDDDLLARGLSDPMTIDLR